METYFGKQAKDLYERATEIINQSNEEIDIPKDFKEEFFKLIDKVNLSLMEDKENFYGYFLFQMKKEVKFDIS
ncbi:MAG: VWA-like domain-containing protein, partial [Peptostreptococcaceae bacterium]